MSRFKGLLMITAWFVLASTSVHAQWKKLETGTLAWLYALEFVDEKRGWAGGSNGSLIVTADGGSSWQLASFPNRDTIRDIVFVDAKNGWLLCERGEQRSAEPLNRSYLLKTEDGGKTWGKMEFAAGITRMVRLVVASTGEGFAIGEAGGFAGMPSGSRFPATLGLPVRFLMLGGAWLNSSRIVLVGGGGTAITSDDLGTSWQQARSANELAEIRLSSVFFLDGSKGWIVGNGGTILSTANGGRYWTQAAPVTGENLLDVRFCDGTTGFAVGENGTIIRSDDGGVRWRSVVSPTPHRLGRLECVGRKAFATGFGGTIVSADIDGR
ncbi:MAG: WD40/YVTN/BNR-like repeat-containing protein [Pyrinomonadaceae bacterium]